ncbi:MAG: NAD(P)/FAD-dependent oxidoreductase, partial [Eubacteriales bacterium]
VFIYVGTRPNSDFVKGLVETDDRGFIITDREMATSVPGIFAAGDVCRKSLRQVVTAVADGAIAIFSAEKYLEL